MLLVLVALPRSGMTLLKRLGPRSPGRVTVELDEDRNLIRSSSFTDVAVFHLFASPLVIHSNIGSTELVKGLRPPELST